MTQKALNKGILVSWTKSFNCTGVVGNDAVQMLKEALNRKGVGIKFGKKLLILGKAFGEQISRLTLIDCSDL